jgi:hypothetical protein
VIAPPQAVLNPNLSALKMMLVKNHRVSVSGRVWYIDDKMAFWPETGRWKMSQSRGGGSGTFRGRAESIFEQIERELLAA